jgi:glucose/arabinose dehydrogenase
MLAFGPDGYLYIGLGDGGSSGDPFMHGQNPQTLLGSILRIDVDADPEAGYAIPRDNPFVGVDGARAEIRSYGLRNPWRFSFDRETGDLWIADVGQNAFEEVNVQPAGEGGLNFGWNLAEGPVCYADPNCETADIVWPVFSYGRDVGISITGGYVYRGQEVAGRNGEYICGDYGTGNIWALTPDGDGAWTASDPMPTDLNISSFAEDAAGELYVIDLNGGVYQITSW